MINNYTNFSFVSLPDELINLIFSHLPAKSLLQAGCICRQWKVQSENPVFWIFFDRLIDLPEKEPTKRTVIENIKSLRQQTTEKNSHVALQAYVTLSQLGFNSLDDAFAYAKTMTIEKEERNTTCQTFYDKCYRLALGYLANHCLTKAEDILQNMVPSELRSMLSLRLITIYLRQNDPTRAFSIQKRLEDNQGEGCRALSLWLEKEFDLDPKESLDPIDVIN